MSCNIQIMVMQGAERAERQAGRFKHLVGVADLRWGRGVDLRVLDQRRHKHRRRQHAVHVLAAIAEFERDLVVER